MSFIPIDKMKQLREAAKNGDEHAKRILRMQMLGEDFGSSLEEYFANPTQNEENKSPSMREEVTDPKLKKFLEYNGVKPGDDEYESTIEAYYQEFPKARPQASKGLEMKATDTNIDVQLPNDDDGSSIYGEEDEPIEDDEKTVIPSTIRMNVQGQEEEKNCIDVLIEDEYEAIDGYDKAISKIVRMDLGDAIKKGVIADLEEIRRDEFDHVEKLKRIKASIEKKEEKEETVGDVYVQ